VGLQDARHPNFSGHTDQPSLSKGRGSRLGLFAHVSLTGLAIMFYARWLVSMMRRFPRKLWVVWVSSQISRHSPRLNFDSFWTFKLVASTLVAVLQPPILRT